MMYYALSMGNNPPKLPFYLGLRHTAGGGPRHGDRPHAQKSVNIARVVLEISSRTDKHSDRQTHTQTCSSQYFVNAPAGEILNTH